LKGGSSHEGPLFFVAIATFLEDVVQVILLVSGFLLNFGSINGYRLTIGSKMKSTHNSARKRAMLGICMIALALLTGFVTPQKLTVKHHNPPQTNPSPPEVNRVCRIVGEILNKPPGHIHQMVRNGEVVIHPTIDGCNYKVDYAGICIEVDGCF
jgi:hypothetical protein